jgi:hypothetical protein
MTLAGVDHKHARMTCSVQNLTTGRDGGAQMTNIIAERGAEAAAIISKRGAPLRGLHVCPHRARSRPLRAREWLGLDFAGPQREG